MTLREPDGAIQQLALDLRLPDASDCQQYETPEQVTDRLEAARNAFLALDDKPGWFGDYQQLVSLGVVHKLAMYVAWAAAPRDRRSYPTVAALANAMGLSSPRAIYRWKATRPEVDELVKLMQAAPLFAHRREIYDALIAVATMPDYKGHADRKLALTLLGDYDPRGEAVNINVSPMSADELAQMQAQAEIELQVFEASLSEEEEA